MVDSYSVRVEVRRQADDKNWAVTDAAIDALVDALTTYAGSVTGGPGYDSWGATVSVEFSPTEQYAKRGAALAAAIAADLVQDEGRIAGLPRGDVARAEATREDVLEEDLAEPQIPDLVSGPEAAQMSGVSLQRWHQLVAANPHRLRPAIQRPHATLWFRAGVDKFAQEQRKPGRPPNITHLAG